MAVTLVGEIVNQCDATTGFGSGGTDTDIFREPTAAIGSKTSNTTSAYITTTLGATAPYDFSSGGGEEDYAMVIWMNGLTPLHATEGMRLIMGSSTASPATDGTWYVNPPAGYTGGFVPVVVHTSIAFSVVSAAGYTTGGNPAQLTNVNRMGGGFRTTTSIMGNFNNVLIDQFTIGQGLRVDAGTTGVPNTFATVATADQGTGIWGWVRTVAGANLCLGKIFIGPATGSATSVFTSTSEIVLFPTFTVGSSASVPAGFYEITIRGAGTDVTLSGDVIKATSATFSLTIDATTNSFTDNGSTFESVFAMTLQAGTSTTGVRLLGTTITQATTVTQNGAYMDGCKVSRQVGIIGTAILVADDLDNIKNCTFTASTNVAKILRNHAIELTTTTGSPFDFDGNTFVGYSASVSQDVYRFDNTTAVNSSSDQITLSTGHGFVSGDPVKYSKEITANTVLTNLAQDATYYVNVSGNAVTLHATQALGESGSSPINLTAGSGNETHALWPALAAIFNDSGGAVTINIGDGGDTPSVRNGLDATTTIVAGAVTVQVTVQTAGGAALSGVRVFLRASDGTGPFPYLESVTIVNSGTTATVTHTGHGMVTGDKVEINDASHWQNNGPFAITVTGVNSYTYTMPSDPGSSPTGSITSTFVALEGTTNGSGVISATRVYATDQPVTGYARLSTSNPFYKTGPINGTVNSATGFTGSAVLILDE